MIFIPGQNTQGKIISYAIWSPKSRHRLLIIPYAESMAEATSIFNANPDVTRVDKNKATKSRSYIEIADQKLWLYGTPNQNKKHSMLMTISQEPLNQLLTRTHQFVMTNEHIASHHPDNTITFGLSGLRDVFDHYHRYCTGDL